jgi:hypothetical protein
VGNKHKHKQWLSILPICKTNISRTYDALSYKHSDCTPEMTETEFFLPDALDPSFLPKYHYT